MAPKRRHPGGRPGRCLIFADQPAQICYVHDPTAGCGTTPYRGGRHPVAAGDDPLTDGQVPYLGEVDAALRAWGGDTNFMPVVGQTKVLPQLLAETRKMLAESWPTDP